MTGALLAPLGAEVVAGVATDDDGLDPVAGPLGLLVVVLLGLALVLLLRSLSGRLRNVRARAELGGYTSSSEASAAPDDDPPSPASPR